MRTYVGVPGAEAMLRQYGIVGTRGKGPWVQGNNIDYVFFSPHLKPLTLRAVLGARLRAKEIDAVPFLSRVAAAYPYDFWANIELGNRFVAGRGEGDGVRSRQDRTAGVAACLQPPGADGRRRLTRPDATGFLSVRNLDGGPKACLPIHG